MLSLVKQSYMSAHYVNNRRLGNTFIFQS